MTRPREKAVSTSAATDDPIGTGGDAKPREKTPPPRSAAEVVAPFDPHRFRVSDLAETLEEIDEAAAIEALAAADTRTSARAIYDRRLRDLTDEEKV